MSDKARISEVVLTLPDGRELKLTADEARAVHTELTKLFGPEPEFLREIYRVVPQHQPIVIQPFPAYPPNWNVPMCGSGNIDGTCTLGINVIC